MKAYGQSAIRGPVTSQEAQVGADLLASKGTSKQPEPPRDLRYLASSRSAIVVWDYPVNFADIAKWRVYKDTENNLVTELSDRSVRQMTVELTSGSNPPVTNVFVSSVNAAGIESVKTVVKVQATTEAGAPAVPSPPAPWNPTRTGCVEVGTPCDDPEGTLIERIPNADWVILSLGDRAPLVMHPDTLVSVWKKASELTADDRIDADANGGWRKPAWIAAEYRHSTKEKRTCPGGTYRARGVRLHNAKKEE